MATTNKHEFSAGARYERKALRNYLNRRINAADAFIPGDAPLPASRFQVYEGILKWVKTREKRYNKKQGGL